MPRASGRHISKRFADSPDGSRDIARSYDDPRVKHIDLAKNIGAGGGLLIREMVHAATGKYLKLFCADDVLLPEGLQTLVDYMESHLDKDFAFGNVQYIDGAGKRIGRTWFDERAGFTLKDDEASCLRKYYCHQSFLPYIGNIVLRSAFDSACCDTTMIMLADVFVWANMLIKGHRIGLIDCCVANYRVHPDQMSAVSAEKIGNVRGYYERFAFRIWLIHHIGKVWAGRVVVDSPYAERMLDDADAEFVVAEDFLRREGDEAAYLAINEMLQDDVRRAQLQERFGFGIAEFRKLYSSAYVKDDSLKGCFRRIYKIILGALSNFPAWFRGKLVRLRRKTM